MAPFYFEGQYWGDGSVRQVSGEATEAEEKVFKSHSIRTHIAVKILIDLTFLNT